MPHADGGAYAPVVATVSLGGSVVLDVYAREEDPRAAPEADGGVRWERRWRVLQEPGSLLVTVGEAYESLKHGIGEVEVDEELGPETVANWRLLGDPGRYEGGRNVRTTRVSLTYRDVLKVVKVPLGILGRRPT
jgi:alkylated DNA repair protein alkB family protein 6